MRAVSHRSIPDLSRLPPQASVPSMGQVQHAPSSSTTLHPQRPGNLVMRSMCIHYRCLFASRILSEEWALQTSNCENIHFHHRCRFPVRNPSPSNQDGGAHRDLPCVTVAKLPLGESWKSTQLTGKLHTLQSIFLGDNKMADTRS